MTTNVLKLHIYIIAKSYEVFLEPINKHIHIHHKFGIFYPHSLWH